MKRILNLTMAVAILCSLAACKKTEQIDPVDTKPLNGVLRSEAVCPAPPAVIGVRITGGIHYCDIAGRITILPNGNINIRGSFGGVVDMNPDAGVYNINGGNGAFYSQTLNPYGSFVGASPMPADTRLLWPTDAQGNRYEAKRVRDADMILKRVFISKINPAGTELWKVEAGLSFSTLFPDMTNSIKLDAAGNVYVANPEGELYKFNSQGQQLSKIGFGEAYARLSLDRNNNAYLYGTSGRLIKVSPQGTILWKLRYEPTTNIPPQILALSTDAAGNIYAAGRISETSDIDPGPGVFKVLSSGKDYTDMFVQKFSPSGEFVWALQTEGRGTTAASTLPYDIKLDSTGDHVIVAGSFRGMVNFKVDGNLVVRAQGECSDGFVLGIKQCR